MAPVLGPLEWIKKDSPVVGDSTRVARSEAIVNARIDHVVYNSQSSFGLVICSG